MSEYLIPIILAIIATVPGIWALLTQRKKDTADVAGKYQSIAAQAAKDYVLLQERVKVLEGEVLHLEAQLEEKDKQIEELQAGVLALRQQLNDAGLKPAWKHKEKAKQE